MHVPHHTLIPLVPGTTDVDLEDEVAPNTTDACALEFNFELASGVTEGTLVFNYVFMSEEYNEYVNSMFNDGFLLLIDNENVAKVPETGDVVSINNINNDVNAGYYNDNEDGMDNTAYNGYTTLMTTSPVELVPAQSYTAKLVIGDAGDYQRDSSLIVEGSSFEWQRKRFRVRI